MTIDFQPNGDVMIFMYNYVKKLIDKLPGDMVGHKATAALLVDHLFKTNGTNNMLLDRTKVDEYHSLTATVLYLGMQIRVGLQLATGFLCTRVKAPDEQDWKKVGHLMKYQQATVFLPLIIQSDGKGTIIYTHGSHSIHSDMNGHGSDFATEGKGTMYSSSTKLKLNTISSTGTEIVAA